MLRANLPARLAAVATAALAGITLLTVAATYAAAARVIGVGDDRALLAGAATAEEEMAESHFRASLLPFSEPQILMVDGSGRPLFVWPGSRLPVDMALVRAAQEQGHAFITLVPDAVSGTLRPRPGPGWLHRLFPAAGEVRVAYVLLTREYAPGVMLMGTPTAEARRQLADLACQLVLIGLAPLPVIALAVRITVSRAFAPVQAAIAARARFVDDAAHELRTPLSIIRTELEVTLKRPRTGEGYRRAIASSLEEVDRLTRLAADLLTLARHDRGERLETEPDVPLRPLLERACTAGAARPPGGGARPPGGGARPPGGGARPELDCPGDLAVSCSPVALEHAVANLVRNAVQATGGAGGAVRVTARRSPGPAGAAGAAIVVEDTGPGIAPDHLPFIFDRFYRVDPARTRGGTGLGLAIVRAVAEAHGGRIDAASQPGQGTTFTIWIPAPPVNLSVLPRAQPARGVPGS